MSKRFYKNKIFILYSFITFSFIAKLFIGWLLRLSFFDRGNSYNSLNSISNNILNFNEFSIMQGIPSIDYEPLYPMLLAISYGLFGENWFGVTFLQAVLHASTSIIIYKIGIIIWDYKAGIFAAVTHCFYPFLFFHSLSVIDTTLFIFLNLALIYSVLMVRLSSPCIRWYYYFFIGFLAALQFLTRGTAIVFIPGLVLVLMIWLWSDISRFRILGYSFSLLVFLLTLSPWVVRNYELTDKLLISSHGSFGLWQGNNERSLELLKNNISLDYVYQKRPPVIYQQYPLKPRDPRQTIEVETVYKLKAFEFIANNPTKFVELAVWKFLKLWSPIYNPTGNSYLYGSTLLRKTLNASSYIPILILSIYGSWQLFLNKEKHSFLIFFFTLILCFTLAHMIVMGYTRLRLPLDPILMLLAGVGFSRTFDLFLNRRKQ